MTSQPAMPRRIITPCNDGRRKPKRTSLCLAFALLLAASLAGCGPEGAGSIKVGDRGRWQKSPEARSPRKPAGKPGADESRPAWKSIKSQLGGSPEKG